MRGLVLLCYSVHRARVRITILALCFQYSLPSPPSPPLGVSSVVCRTVCTAVGWTRSRCHRPSWRRRHLPRWRRHCHRHCHCSAHTRPGVLLHSVLLRTRFSHIERHWCLVWSAALHRSGLDSHPMSPPKMAPPLLCTHKATCTTALWPCSPSLLCSITTLGSRMVCFTLTTWSLCHSPRWRRHLANGGAIVRPLEKKVRFHAREPHLVRCCSLLAARACSTMPLSPLGLLFGFHILAPFCPFRGLVFFSVDFDFDFERTSILFSAPLVFFRPPPRRRTTTRHRLHSGARMETLEKEKKTYYEDIIE